MATPLEIPDCAITRLTCTQSDSWGYLTKGRQYNVHRFGKLYTIHELNMTFGWDYFVSHFG